MACMKIGTKAEAFRHEEHTCQTTMIYPGTSYQPYVDHFLHHESVIQQCTTGLPSDATIEIGEMSFHLHKFPLITRSGLMTKLIGDLSNEDEHVCVVHLDEIPGGSKTFELVTRFCYDVKIEVTAHNVISLRCAAEYLQMTDDYGDDNLITLTENFLIEVFATWSDTVKALESCEEVLCDAEELFLVPRCIDSLAAKACTGFNASVNNTEKNAAPPTSIVWNGISSANKPETTREDWWHRDVSFLGLHLYKQVIQAIASRGMKPETIARSLLGYVKRYIPLMNRQSSFNDANHFKTVSCPSEADQRYLFEDIVDLLPSQKGIIATKFLIRLLRTAMILHVSPSCRENLEKRVGAQLDSAVLDDILIPNQGFNTVETLYDIDCFQRILDYFLSMDQAPSTLCSPCIVEEAGSEGGPQSLGSITSVANLVDAFLADVAADVNMNVSKFQSLAASVPDYARALSDGIYRAIDIYLKAHPWLSDTEREQMCRLMNVQKLSLDASTHAARNERLPLRVIVQVLFFEQLRLRTSIAGWFYVSENIENTKNENGDGEEVRSQDRERERERERGSRMAGMGEMKDRVHELERDCETIKYEIRKMVKKTKRSWNSLCKRKTKNI